MRNIHIDAIKGFSIIAIVLYHLGILPYGYLGVDVFLVINGYFITKELIQSFQNDTFSYWDFLINKLTRLWPLVVIACTVSLCIGWYYMLPDDYENLAESVVASSTFSQKYIRIVSF